MPDTSKPAVHRPTVEKSVEPVKKAAKRRTPVKRAAVKAEPKVTAAEKRAASVEPNVDTGGGVATPGDGSYGLSTAVCQCGATRLAGLIVSSAATVATTCAACGQTIFAYPSFGVDDHMVEALGQPPDHTHQFHPTQLPPATQLPEPGAKPGV